MYKENPEWLTEYLDERVKHAIKIYDQDPANDFIEQGQPGQFIRGILRWKMELPLYLFDQTYRKQADKETEEKQNELMAEMRFNDASYPD